MTEQRTPKRCHTSCDAGADNAARLAHERAIDARRPRQAKRRTLGVSQQRADARGTCGVAKLLHDGRQERSGIIEIREAECREVIGTRTNHRARTILKVRIEKTGAEIQVEPLPTVNGDREQLAVLFRNLIDNATKFVAQRRPRIRVSARQQTSHWLFSVRDNGIGIEHPDESIFTMFKRLSTDYPGTGLGLALCRRIVEQHGGRIWVDSTPGVGSTFRFTIPLASRQSRSEDDALRSSAC